MNTPKPPPVSGDAEALRRWNRAAEAWSEHADRLAAMTRDASDALLAALAPRKGNRILDLACGPGDPALTLAERVGPGGRVVCVDAVETMLTTLRVRAAARGLGIDTVRAHAAGLPFADSAFDGLCCRFGLMFMSQPHDVLSEAARVLHGGGRAVFVVWGAPERNPCFTLPAWALDQVGAPEAPKEGPTVFECHETGPMEALLRQAGFRQVRVGVRAFSMRFGSCAPDELLDRQTRLSGPLADRVQDLDADRFHRARRLVAEQVAGWVDAEGHLSLPGEIVVASGIAP